MPQRAVLLVVTLSSLSTTAALAQEGGETEPSAAPESEPSAGDDDVYTDKGSWELGGSASLNWFNDVLTIALSPTVGYFFMDDLELSAILTYTYVRTEDPGGGHSTAKSGTFVLEPSYHHPLGQDLHVFGGLGVGFSYDGNDWNFDVVPRAGVNWELAPGVIITPDARLPIVIGDDTTVGVTIGVGVTSSF